MFCLSRLFKKPESNETCSEWSPNPKWTQESASLLHNLKIEVLPQPSLEEIIRNSDSFPIEFPTKTNRCNHLKNIVNENELLRNITSAYPVIHEKVLQMCCDFILFKREHGNDNELEFYKAMTPVDLINRLLSKRAVVFVGPYDKYMLLDGATGLGHWEDIGSCREQLPLTMENYMTYDELKLSSLLAISSYTYFINEGHRKNRAEHQEDRNKIEEEGIIIGLVGPRLHKTGAVENQEIVYSKRQHSADNGYGRSIKTSLPKLFADFYEEECLDYHEMNKKKHSGSNGRYVNLFGQENIFDNTFYVKRLTISFDTLLGEADARGSAVSKSVYVHMVGIGLGVWKVSGHQDKLFMDTFGRRILTLGDKLHNISDVCLAYMAESKCAGYSHGDTIPIEGHPNGGIKIHICNRNPHEKLTGEDEGKLLVVTFAWDGNSLPGNEYWFGSLASSSDPAAACSTQVAEIHNPHINPYISGENLRIVTDGTVVTLKEYIEKIGSSVQCDERKSD
ncbi:uncharacterized protein LOC126888790 isoform X2 [Diabrotica virgifera virgifera]|uniref:Uncharacterized protein LOC114336659 n=1 Tax=Diabrotica virgifera virgifera TaxID=50390 RepID=A0A6P7GD44_DIAVI|nr:uncharacterized protein LOC126888790 isoform X2 [Diabrotica virgifera virgifera]